MWLEKAATTMRPFAETKISLSVSPTDRLTRDVIRQLADHGVHHVLAPVFSLDREKIFRRLEATIAL